MNRRQFIRKATVAGAGFWVLPAQLRAGGTRANEKLNVALIGVWGRGLAFYDVLAEENVVALCDVNEKRFPDALKKFPRAKTYVDWRRLLDDCRKLKLDAVVCCTPDHHHAFIANWCLNRDLHCYMEKPLAITVEEARVVRANYLKKKGKIATQVGMQRHAFPNFNRIRELVHDGAIGQLSAAFAWGDRQVKPAGAEYDPQTGIIYLKKEGKPVAGYLPAEGQPPEGLHWDLWLGPSPEHPYNPGYFALGPGMNCLSWNMFWDFGAGQIGDMGSHTMDLVWNVIDAVLPTSVEAKGDPFNPAITPIKCEVHFEMPANEWRGAIRVSWYQGGAMPGPPRPYVDLKKIGHGAMFKGSKGFLVADFTSRVLLPFGDDADLTYYKPRPKEKLLPPVGDFQKQWLAACRNPGLKTACDFEYSANMIETMLLGLVAYRVGRKIQYDGAAGKVTNCSEANPLLGKKYRAGWVLNG